MALIRWRPYHRRALSLRDANPFWWAMDRLFDENLGWPTRWMDWSERDLSMPIDMRETDGHLVLSADLPGLKPEDVDIDLRGNTLTIKGEYKSEDTEEDENVYYHERRYGKFHRALELPFEVEADEIEAEFEDGVLELTMPKVEETQPSSCSAASLTFNANLGLRAPSSGWPSSAR